MGPGETADFIVTPLKPGDLKLEVWVSTSGARVEVAAPVLPQTPELEPDSELELERELEPGTESVPGSPCTAT